MFRKEMFTAAIIFTPYKSSRPEQGVIIIMIPPCPEVFCKKGFLRNFAKFSGKHLCQSLFFNKVKTLLKKGSDTGVFL